MRSTLTFAVSIAVLIVASTALADRALLKVHCAKCHSGDKPKGEFALSDLGVSPSRDRIDFWVNALDYVKLGEMPPAKQSQLADGQRERLIAWFEKSIGAYESQSAQTPRYLAPRRLNNRELANSISDVLMIEDVGTHQPTANLLGDTLKDGFDTNSDALGLSEFHLEQYIAAIRQIVDATILTGERPATITVKVDADDLRMTSRSQRRRNERANRTDTSIEILDIRLRAFMANFETVPYSGRYKIKLRATGIDRGVYDEGATGVYHDDPIRVRVHLGDRTRDFDLPDNDVMEIEVDQWLAAGTRLQLSYPTDGLRQQGNGNFKFQYRIAHDYLKEHNRDLYEKIVSEITPKRSTKAVTHWSHWTEHWQGPRPRLFNAEVAGPIYESWPPKRHLALLGADPKAESAANILRPIAQRAWRRQVRDGELDPIVRLVQSKADSLGDVGAFKEGIVAIFVSPSFLLINADDVTSADRFATKLSYFLQSTTPNPQLQTAARNEELTTYTAVRAEVARQFKQGEADEFLREFPQAWLQLDRISFMAPDPVRYPLYDRKRISEDMVNEVLHFFRDAIEHNVPIPELISADHSFLNADLAKVYDVRGVPQDSRFRKYTFTDGRRGGLLGMGAFLTLTADSLSTSPIHRAVYVMENFMGIHPKPPPANVNIEEPDVRQAKTIKAILEAHRSDTTCASCHQSIDPYGYAFENFDPIGAWRDNYLTYASPKQRGQESIPIDASATFRNGDTYQDITQFRQLMSSDANRDRFVRCFIAKLLTYANGTAPDAEDYSEIEKIITKSAEHNYRIVDTIAAVVDSPLFRDR